MQSDIDVSMIVNQPVCNAKQPEICHAEANEKKEEQQHEAEVVIQQINVVREHQRKELDNVVNVIRDCPNKDYEDMATETDFKMKPRSTTIEYIRPEEKIEEKIDVKTLSTTIIMCEREVKE